MKKIIFLSWFVFFIFFLSSYLLSQTLDQDKNSKFVKDKKVFVDQGIISLKSRHIEFNKDDFSLGLSKNQNLFILN